MSGIKRFLPNNEYLAATGANNPSDVNPYATIADLSSGSAISDDVMPRGNAAGDGIEDGTWQNVGNDIYPTTTGSNIGDATHRIGTLFMSSTIDHTTDLDLISGATTFNTFRSNGSVHLAMTGGAFEVGLSSNAKLKYQSGVLEHRTPTGVGTTWVGFTTYHDTNSTQVGLFANKFGYNALRYSHDYRWETWTGTVSTTSVERMRLTSDGNLGLGSVSSPNGRFHLRGVGNTNATRLLTYESNNGIDRLIIQDDGQTGSFAGGTAAINSNFGHYHQSAGYTTGHAFYGGSGTVTTMLVQDISSAANSIAISAGFQNTPTATATAIKGFQSQDGPVTSIGLHGIARNGSNNTWAVYAQISGGWTAARIASPPTDVRALYANAAPTGLDTIVYAGYFSASPGTPGNADTQDKIAVLGTATNNSVASGATSNAIAAQFKTLTSGGSGTGTGNMALNVPLIGNDGTVVFGASSVSANASFVEVTGDIEVIGAGGGNGLILEAPNANRYRVTVNNAGALVITSA